MESEKDEMFAIELYELKGGAEIGKVSIAEETITDNDMGNTGSSIILAARITNLIKHDLNRYLKYREIGYFCSF